MKRPNGAGGVRKLSGRRRHPWQAVVSAGHEIRNNVIVTKQVSIGCFATRKEALEALGEWNTSHLRVDLRSMTVKDVCEKIRPDVNDKKNFDAICKRYAETAKMRLIDVRTYHIEEIPLPPLSSSYHSKIRSFWHKVFMYGIENDIVAKDYSEFIRFHDTTPRKHKEIFTPDEIELCMGVKLYRLLLYTGMRINELLTMRTDQVYEEDGILCFHVVKSKTEAGKRIIPVHSAIINDINLSDEYVIGGAYNTVRKEFVDFMNENGISPHVLHDFRRTFASYAMSCGVSDYYTKCLMGHNHNDITHDIYTQAFVKDLKSEIEKIRFL